MPSSSRRSSTALYDRVAAQLRHSLDAGEDKGGGLNGAQRLNGLNVLNDLNQGVGVFDEG
jgi:hypothetical protein